MTRGNKYPRFFIRKNSPFSGQKTHLFIIKKQGGAAFTNNHYLEYAKEEYFEKWVKTMKDDWEEIDAAEAALL